MNWPTPKFLILTQNNQFSKRKLFLHPFERTTHLLHSVGPPKKEISTQKILTLTRKNEKKKKKSRPPERANFLPNKSFFYTYLKKK